MKVQSNNPVIARRSFQVLAVSLVLLGNTINTAQAENEEPALKIVNRDGVSISVTATALQGFPRTELEAKDHDGSTAKYEGVEVSHLLARAGAAQGEQLRGEWVRCVVLIEAADGYRAVFALPEFDPAFTDRKILLADTRNGAPLADDQGPLRIIIPDEKRHSRWVRLVNRIRMVDVSDLAPEQE